MARVSAASEGDQRQARATPVRARAQASRQSLVQAAMALWRTKGFDETTITDICKAAGVSKALFYVYFSRKEDVLEEAEVFAISDAHDVAAAVATQPYELVDVVSAIVEALARRMSQFPSELVFAAVLENYRIERRALLGGATEADLAALFLEPFTQAQRDGKLRRNVDLVRASRIGQSLVSDGIRRWAATEFTGPSIANDLAVEIADVVARL